ncbi:unnamed protein product [Thlaspi arvense]|uniref:EGF-like calcium-binding domain-containing protein n=1 Tax=Thlaspi arvense TaxID=13288 RepID=A0AAU9SWT8_THLAR|nr:unnamed protein product [Thlaspi arvense]
MMRRLENVGLVLMGWVMVWLGSCTGRFVVEKNNLRVTSPESIRGVYECALGNFGIPQYGGSMAGTVVYPKANQKACKNFDDFEISFKSRISGLPIFVLVDRGDCYFTLKAWNAQRAGAATILVADNRPEPLITMDAPEDETADADYLQNITIPSALVSRSLGSAIKEAIAHGEPVHISLDWREALPHPNDRELLRFSRREATLASLPTTSPGIALKPFWQADSAKRSASMEEGIVLPTLSKISPEGVDVKKIDKCIGDIEANAENPVLKDEQEAQVGKGARGDVTILPTIVINNRQYRGKLERSAVLKALCSGFRETTEPPICLTEDIETNECLQNNGGCWEDKTTNITACRDTFRGRVCQCPIVQGVKFLGDGYTHCEASGALRCGINNGGCWKHTQMGKTYSACRDDHSKGCKCPPGFKGDGLKNCQDVNECEEKTACQCRGCKCKNTWGSYECSCSGSLLYIREHDICINKDARGDVSLGVILIIVMGLGAAALGAYTVYKYRIRTYMDSEIRAIMAQYMPLDNHPNTQLSSQLEL